MMAASERFVFNFTAALQEQLIAAFEALDPVPLTAKALAGLPKGRGVYRLHYPSPDLAYVGKADNLPHRLSQHLRKISGRQNISIDDVGFTCLYIEESLMTASPEGVLIQHYGKTAAWNNSGFGSNDPGERRDRQVPGIFNATYPINLEAQCGVAGGDYSANEFIKALAASMPFSIRVDQTKPALAEREKAIASVPDGLTCDEACSSLIAALRDVCAADTVQWAGAALHGYVVMYKTAVPYPHLLRAF